MSRLYFIYTHTSPTGKVYVGQTVDIKKRWGYNGEHYKTKKKDGSFVQPSFARAIIKYGWDNFEHKVVLENVEKGEADYAEKYLIRWYKMHHISYNCTDGGEGVCGIGRVYSEEERKSISERVLKNPPMKGKKHTPEAIAKIIAASKARVYTAEQKAKMSELARKNNLGKKHSEETRKKFSEYRKAHPETWVGGWNKKEVHQYNLDGAYLASYPSAECAALSINKKYCTDICNCIKGKCSSAYGYIWKADKVDSVELSNYKVVKTAKGARLLDLSEDKRLARSSAHGKAVNQYSLSGKYLNTYCSASEAGRQLGIYHSGIAKCCNHKDKYRTAGGYMWEFDTESNRKNKCKTL